MSSQRPLVTVGIPTYNRELLVGRAIDSVLHQDYPHVEIVISDNCSTDSTPRVCQGYADQDPRIRYVQQPRNVGPTGNFEMVLTLASGEYFMWLGDDDYIDGNYVSSALEALQSDPQIYLASGYARYYRHGVLVSAGKALSVSAKYWPVRIAQYYAAVSDNAVFYGLMRKSTADLLRLENVFGGDWLAIARIASLGKIVMIDRTFVHRELGGISQSYPGLAKSLGLSQINGRFPRLSVAMNVARNLSARNSPYAEYPLFERYAAAALSVGVMSLRAVKGSMRRGFATLTARRPATTKTRRDDEVAGSTEQK